MGVGARTRRAAHARERNTEALAEHDVGGGFEGAVQSSVKALPRAALDVEGGHRRTSGRSLHSRERVITEQSWPSGPIPE